MRNIQIGDYMEAAREVASFLADNASKNVFLIGVTAHRAFQIHAIGPHSVETMLRGRGVFAQVNRATLSLELENGSRLRAFGSDRLESLRGIRADGLWEVEAWEWDDRQETARTLRKVIGWNDDTIRWVTTSG